MPVHDEWGQDPTVLMMRQIFSLMERAQKEFLQKINLSPFDPRLRRARARARDLFEQTWHTAIQKERISPEGGASLLYLHCLARALKWSGIDIPEQALPKDDRIEQFLQEEWK